MSCYYREVFASGVLASFFIFAIVVMFEEVIREWVRKILILVKGMHERVEV